MDKAIEALKRQTEQFGAGEGHMKFGMKDGTTAVLSVYTNARPSNEVLDDLIEYTEEHEDQTLLDLISDLSERK